MAAGADKAVLLSDRAFANADTLATSYGVTPDEVARITTETALRLFPLAQTSI